MSNYGGPKWNISHFRRRVPGQPKVQQSWNMLGDVLHLDESIGHDGVTLKRWYWWPAAFHPPVGIEAAALPAGMPREGKIASVKVQGTSETGFSFWVLRADKLPRPFGSCI